MSQTPIIHVIDDDDALRQALVGLFRSMSMQAVAYGSVQQFLAVEGRQGPGCLVLDVRLPGLSGLDFQKRMADEGVTLPVVLMTGHGDIPMSVQAMKAGAVDFLTKPFRDQDLLDAVAAAIELDANRRLARAEADDLQTLYASLSPRERQVMTLAASGQMNKQIAAELDLSEVTVKIHRGAAMRKMRARSFAELVRMADLLGDGA